MQVLFGSTQPSHPSFITLLSRNFSVLLATDVVAKAQASRIAVSQRSVSHSFYLLPATVMINYFKLKTSEFFDEVQSACQAQQSESFATHLILSTSMQLSANGCFSYGQYNNY